MLHLHFLLPFSCPSLFPCPSLQFSSDLCLHLLHFSLPLVISSTLFTLLVHFPLLISYLLLVDIVLSQVEIRVFPLLNLFPAYVLFCQLFRDLVNIRRPDGNQPVGVSSLCVNWSRHTYVCMYGKMWETGGGYSTSFGWVRDEFKIPEGKKDSAVTAGWNRSDVVLWSLLDRKQTVLGRGKKWNKQITSLLMRTMFLADYRYRVGKWTDSEEFIQKGDRD